MQSRGLRKEILTLFNLEAGGLIFDIEANMRTRIAVAFSPDSRQLAIANDTILTTWDTHSGQEIHKFIGHSDRITQVTFSPDGKILASVSRDKTAKLWNPNSGKSINTFAGHNKAINAIVFNPNGQIVATAGEDRFIKIWETNTLKPIHNLIGHTNDIHSLSISSNGKILISASADGTTRMWSLQTTQPLATLFALANKDWLVVTPDGKFDGTQEAMKQLHYVKNLDIIPLESLFENYYTPRLLSKILNNELLESVTAKVSILQPIPVVQIVSPENNSTHNQEQVKITVKATDQGGGIDEVRLYHNGKHLDGTTRGFKSTGQNHEFTVTLTNGENRIKATAFNSQRTESIPDEIVVHYKAPEVVKPNMHILAVGINNYLNPKYNLNYAKNDADAFVKSLSSGASTLFGKVEVTEINDANATKTGILAAIDKIKATAKAEDVFVFYYAGHGVMSSGNGVEKPQFYLVPHDVTKMYEADEMLKKSGISATEIGEFSKTIKAQKQLFVIDACQSGGAMQTLAMRGAAEEKAIAQLARSTGTYFIAASGTEQFATEVAELGHGIFTYSVIEALKGSCKSQDGKITVNLLKSCVEDLVPELSKKHKGQPQFPTGYGFGMDFPVVMVK
jgi:WD40 repeat protein